MNDKTRHFLKSLLFTTLVGVFFIYVFPIILFILFPKINNKDLFPFLMCLSLIFTIFYVGLYPKDR